MRVREYFLREIGCWKIWIFADTVYKRTGPVCVHDLQTILQLWHVLHVHVRWAPKKCTPRVTLHSQKVPVKIRNLPSSELPWRQLSISPSIYWGNLHWCDFWCGEGEPDFSGCSGWKPAICFQVTTGRLWHSSLLFVSLSVSWLRNSRWLTESLRLFFHSIHGQPFISHLSETVLPNS